MSNIRQILSRSVDGWLVDFQSISIGQDFCLHLYCVISLIFLSLSSNFSVNNGHITYSNKPHASNQTPPPLQSGSWRVTFNYSSDPHPSSQTPRMCTLICFVICNHLHQEHYAAFHTTRSDV